MSETFDTVIVGSSPGSILEAIVAKRSGRNVCVVDRNSSIGGAWSVFEVLSSPAVESAPHFFQSAVDLSFLTEDLSFDLVDVPRTKWKIKIKGLKMSLNDRMAKLLAASLLAARLLLRRRMRAFKDVRDDRATHFRGAINQVIYHLFSYREATDYFKGGCGGFLAEAERVARAEGVQFRTAEIDTIDKNGKVLVLGSGSQEPISCSQLWVTPRSTFESFRDGSVSHQFDRVCVYRNQIHMRVQSDVPLEFYLYRFIGIGFFALVNLSLIGNTAERKNEFMLCVTLADMSAPVVADRGRVQEILLTFQRLGILPDCVSLLEYESSTYLDSRLDQEAFEVLKRLGHGSVREIGNIDFAVWATDIAPRWQTNVERND